MLLTFRPGDTSGFARFAAAPVRAQRRIREITMVSVTSSVPAGELLDEKAIQQWLDSFQGSLGAEEQQRLSQASRLLLAAQQPASGESTWKHALSVTDILARMQLDWETLVAALLHLALPPAGRDYGEIEARFGAGVARMLGDMARIGSLAIGAQTSRRQSASEHSENIRRMMLSIADDIRVVLIVLAERLHDMRTLKHQPQEVREREARETLDIYAPLANRLGIWQIKWELEDLCLRYLHPQEYQEIAQRLDGRRADREGFIGSVIQLLQEKFSAVGIKAEISGRPKHIYSIWRKMKRKAVDFEQIFDLRALRVLVESVADCYAALGVVHGIWRHIPGEFDDYIATPKANLYRSIHTAVIGPEDKPLEIQIRTREMHEHAELGVAAHWRYKEPGQQDAEFERRISLMRNWLELKDDPSGSEDFVDNLKTGFEAQQVYVLTPQGRVIELPKGATAVDFAYAIHSSVGHRCRGARVDGRITPLTHPLVSGQTVEVLTVKEGGPSRDWLSPHHGYLKTNKARNRVRHWFKQQDYQAHLNAGRASLEKEISRLGVARPDLEQALRRFNFQRADDLLAAIGRGEVSPVQVAGMGAQQPVLKETAEALPAQRQVKRHKGRHRHEAEVIVEGVDDLLTHMARCCKPVPYDGIVGFITRGRGVTVHRNDCAMITGLEEEEQGRLVNVVWADQSEEAAFAVDIRVLANDRKGLLRDISSIFTNEEVDVLGVNSQSNRKTDRASMRFTIEIKDMRQLSRLLEKVSQLPDVLEARRQV